MGYRENFDNYSKLFKISAQLRLVTRRANLHIFEEKLLNNFVITHPFKFTIFLKFHFS